MNVYFIDPIYVKPEGWKPLLSYLKVKVVYSFIPSLELPKELFSLIKSYLIVSYLNTDKEEFVNNCTYWLREHFENSIRLVTEDYKNHNDCPREKRYEYSSRLAKNNIEKVDEDNCLILMPLISKYNEAGVILSPHSIGSVNLRYYPTHIASYCLNILHKKYGHYLYHTHSAFIMFDRYFIKAYEFDPKSLDWSAYMIRLKNGKSINFMSFVNEEIHKLAKEYFPIVDCNGVSKYTMLRTHEGDLEYKKLLEKAKEAAEEYEEENDSIGNESDWNKEVQEMNRAFWRECGEGGSNCESWPGWD